MEREEKRFVVSSVGFVVLVGESKSHSFSLKEDDSEQDSGGGVTEEGL